MNLRVLIVAESASAQYGGEAVLPLHYYRVLRQRGVPVWLIVHERTRTELQELFPDDPNITYIPNTIWHRFLWRVGCWLPDRLACFTVGFIIRLMTQIAQRQIVHNLVKAEKIDVIHQPTPVSPKEPSMIFGMGVPVVIGPMNGGIDYPPAFQQMQGSGVNFVLRTGRLFSGVMNRLIPGKKQAALLLVANQRTREALPKGVSERVIELVENGVDLSLWEPPDAQDSPQDSPITRYVFVGRLVDWKAVGLLLEAFVQAHQKAPMALTIIGDGIERKSLEEQARELSLLTTQTGTLGEVFFAGWMPQKDCAVLLRQSDVLVLPSLMECGGAVVLEAMAMGMPVIATNWGGPMDYLDDTCGILVDPASRDGFIGDLAAAMVRLAQAPEERKAMGQAGRDKVVRCFDWEVKVNRILEVYRDVVAPDPTRPPEDSL